jgi:hypothetical protein
LCGAKIQRVFTLTNVKLKIFSFVFPNFAIRKKTPFMKPAKTIILMVLCLSCTYSIAQVSLRYKLERGNIFNIKQESDQTILQKMDGLSNKVNNHIEAIMQFKVLAERPDGYEMVVSFKDIEMSIRSETSEEILDIDLTKPDESGEKSIFNGLLDYPIKLVLKFNGDITQISGCENLIDHMINGANIKDDFTRDLMRASLDKDFGPEAMSQNYKQMTYFYPGKKVFIDESWHTQTKGLSNMDNTWKLVSMNDRNAILAANGTIHMNVYKSGITMKLAGKQKSYLITDAYTGILQELTIEGTATGNSQIEMEEGGTYIPTTVTSKIKYNLIN